MWFTGPFTSIPDQQVVEPKTQANDNNRKQTTVNDNKQTNKQQATNNNNTTTTNKQTTLYEKETRKNPVKTLKHPKKQKPLENNLCSATNDHKQKSKNNQKSKYRPCEALQGCGLVRPKREGWKYEWSKTTNNKQPNNKQLKTTTNQDPAKHYELAGEKMSGRVKRQLEEELSGIFDVKITTHSTDSQTNEKLGHKKIVAGTPCIWRHVFK
jgi:hypothetical protein